MVKELSKELAENKARFIAYATRHIDTPTIRKQASKLFDDANKKKGNKSTK